MWLASLAAAAGLAGAAMAAGSAGLAGVDVLVRTDKRSYSSGEPIVVALEIVNRGAKAVDLSFSTAQRYDVRIKDGQGGDVWRSSQGQMFAQVLGTERLEPSRRLRYRVSVRQGLSPGAYTIVAVVPAMEGRLSSEAGIKVQ
jgi:hypothetical protein